MSTNWTDEDGELLNAAMQATRDRATGAISHPPERGSRGLAGRQVRLSVRSALPHLCAGCGGILWPGEPHHEGRRRGRIERCHLEPHCGGRPDPFPRFDRANRAIDLLDLWIRAGAGVVSALFLIVLVALLSGWKW